MIHAESFLRVAIDNLKEMRRWFARNHGNTESMWLVRFKKSGPMIYVNRLDVLNELHCRDWVDGLAHKLDDERTMHLISPSR